MIDPKNKSALLYPACMFQSTPVRGATVEARVEAHAGSPWFSTAGMVRIENFEL